MSLDTLNRSGLAIVTNPPRATALGPSFDAWRLREASDQAQPLDITATTLAEAVDAAKVRCDHKDTFVVREIAPLGDTATVHFYAVTRDSKGRWTTVDHVPRKVHDLSAKHLFSMRVSAFAPVEPWRWAPGCDVVGLGGVVQA